jgi:hypothetical protein
VLWKLASEQAVSSDASKEMIGIIARSSLHASLTPPPPPLPVQVPAPPTPPGGPGALHDAAIIYGAHSFVYVIQVRDIGDATAGAQLIGKITKLLNDAL